MTRFLLHRPIAVGMSFAALIIFGAIAWKQLPVSLLPPAEVPRLMIRIFYPNSGPQVIEQNLLSTLRESLRTLSGLEDMYSQASNETGYIELQFGYRTRMNLTYLEVNEKIDRLTAGWPSNIERPQVLRIAATDIPIMRVQVYPQRDTDLTQLTVLAQNVLRRRLEQIKGVSLVDLNGAFSPEIVIQPHPEKLAALGLGTPELEQALKQANQELGGVSVRDGQYHYYLRMVNRLQEPGALKVLPISLPKGGYVELQQVADVKWQSNPQGGKHIYNGKTGLVLTVHKQAQARMEEVTDAIDATLEVFIKDYPQYGFAITRDQSALLQAGISNLTYSLIFGGLFAFAILFIFMGNLWVPIIMGISLPASLMISFLVFYAFGLSLNIISLSGLALGLGMLIDNAIIVLDNISRKREEGMELTEACVEGVREVQTPMISSVLTTLAVFVPLIFLGGVSGALFYDQALALSIILIVSLGVAFILLPLLYKLILKKKAAENSRFFLYMLNGYQRSHQFVMKSPMVVLVIVLLLIPAAFYTGKNMDIKGLPEISADDLVMKIHWDQSIRLEENTARIAKLIQSLPVKTVQEEADAGITRFLLNQDPQTLQEAEVYLRFENPDSKGRALSFLQEYLPNHYPASRITIRPSDNPFYQLVGGNKNYFEIRWKTNSVSGIVAAPRLPETLRTIPVQNYQPGPGAEVQSQLSLHIDYAKMQAFGINQQEVFEKVEQLFGEQSLTEIKSGGNIIPVKWVAEENDYQELLRKSSVKSKMGAVYPLSTFTIADYQPTLKNITADKSGPFQSVILDYYPSRQQQGVISEWAREHEFKLTFSGGYFSDRNKLARLFWILGISCALLYFILAAQFESFGQPFIVILSLPLGVGGSLLALWLAGQSLNLMSAIGLIVMLGIMVNDAILKVDTINRLYLKQGVELTVALSRSGMIRLKPILMTSITTILALLPVLLAAGIGAELQVPLVISVIGGLVAGTVTSLYFVPLVYKWFTSKPRKYVGI
jgi:multidrug efflux pump subunit AcrB